MIRILILMLITFVAYSQPKYDVKLNDEYEIFVDESILLSGTITQTFTPVRFYYPQIADTNYLWIDISSADSLDVSTLLGDSVTVSVWYYPVSPTNSTGRIPDGVKGYAFPIADTLLSKNPGDGPYVLSLINTDPGYDTKGQFRVLVSQPYATKQRISLTVGVIRRWSYKY